MRRIPIRLTLARLADASITRLSPSILIADRSPPRLFPLRTPASSRQRGMTLHQMRLPSKDRIRLQESASSS